MFIGLEVYEMKSRNCISRIDWFGLIVGFALFSVGGILTMTFVGAVVGVPLLLASLGPLTDHTTLLGTPCAS